MNRAKLVEIYQGKIKVHNLSTEQDYVIGTDEFCQIKISEVSVSRKHAVIRRRHNHFLLLDLASTRGTMVNDRTIISKELMHGDLIKIGAVKLTFCDRCEVQKNVTMEEKCLDTVKNLSATNTFLVQKKSAEISDAVCTFSEQLNNATSKDVVLEIAVLNIQKNIARSVYCLGENFNVVASRGEPGIIYRNILIEALENKCSLMANSSCTPPDCLNGMSIIPCEKKFVMCSIVETLETTFLFYSNTDYFMFRQEQIEEQFELFAFMCNLVSKALIKLQKNNAIK